jgi:gamma-glutamylaminecyclotransferase
MHLFVYGTLKRGHSNHGYLRGQQFISMAMTLPRFRLHDLGGYPGMVLDERDGISIHGEIWDVDADCLARLDELEDIEGGEYQREIIPLMPPHDQSCIEGYRYLRDVSQARDIGASW